MVRDFGGEDETKSLKVFSKPSTQTRVSMSEKRHEVRIWQPPCLIEKEREVRVLRPPRLATSASDIGMRDLCLAIFASDIETRGLHLLEEFEFEAL